MQIMRPGTKVRYRNAAGRVQPAVVTAVTNQTTLNLRIGNGPTRTTITGAAKVARKGVTVGWFQGAR